MHPTEQWFWEGNVQSCVAAHLVDEEWSVISSVDTASQQTGVDLVLEREGERLNVEVKGWPSEVYVLGDRAGQPKPTNPTVQARHWFAGALLSAVLIRDAKPQERVALAFPDVARYRDLLARSAQSLAAIRVEALLVDDGGRVVTVDPRSMAVDRRRGSVTSLQARRRAPEASGHTGKYRALWQWLHGRTTAREELTFAQIEQLLGLALPASCYDHSAHWSGYEGSAVARAIADAGWRARPDLDGRRVILERREPR
jgi:hypothetical protein